MATYDNLPVYKESYDLILIIFKLTKDFNREYKYTIGENLKKEITELILNIYRANSTENKKPYIQAARERIEVVRLLVRILKDLNQINIEKMVAVNIHIESVSKQLFAWQRAYQ